MGTVKIQGELWGAAPEGWATIQEHLHQPLFEAMLEAAQVGQGSHVLDAGCGSGLASLLAAKRGARVSGIDAAASLLAYAQERVPQGDFRVGDIEVLPFDDNTFSGVIAANSLQYSADRLATLRGFARVCKEGGRIVVGLFSTPDKVAYDSIFADVRKALPAPPPGKGTFELSMPGVLESLFEEAGLSIIESDEVDAPFHYSDYEEFWKANSSAGPFQGMMQLIGEDFLKEALREPVLAFRQHDGTINIGPNYFKYLVSV